MKRDIKKRIERALTALKEPGGSTIRSIIKIVNKETPILSLRKVLEALQDGINEGFLCMYNGRFKLKKHLMSPEGFEEADASNPGDYLDEDMEDEEMLERTFEREMYKNGSDMSLERDGSLESERDDLLELKESESDKGRAWRGDDGGKRDRVTGSKGPKHQSGGVRGQSDRLAAKMTCDSSENDDDESADEDEAEVERDDDEEEEDEEFEDENNGSNSNSECDSVPDMGGYDESRGSRKPGAGAGTENKTEYKKQRGPRCTSMKKDVRMPSKVNIPFLPPQLPQKSSNFNELLRRSPEPVNGPLFDSHNDYAFTPDKLEFFGAYR